MLSTNLPAHVRATFLLLPLIFAQAVYSQNVSITLPLNKTLPWANKELYGEFYYLNASSTLQVNLTNPNKYISYIIFQMHSHLYNVTLYNNTLTRGSTVVGTNVGLYSPVKPAMDTFYIYNQNPDVQVSFYISVHGYEKTDPIPGGCNMEFPIAISPFLRTTFNSDYITVDAAGAKDTKDPKCKTIDSAVVLFYKLYIPERQFDAEAYFKGIKDLLTMDSIVDNGEFIPESGDHMRRRLSAYPGTGSVYAAVAFSTLNKSAYSVYVPAVTYACNPLVDGDCDVLDDSLSHFLCALLFFIGLFVCYFGHRFFKTEMFLVGSISGVIITYILISLISDIDRPALLGASILSGACFGAIWLLFWWFYGIPIFAVFLSTLNVGFLFAALIYHGLPGGLIALQADFNFWTLFILIMLLTSLMLVSMTFLSNILCCAILGSYAAIFPMDYYVGSNLKYIVINTVRRATVPKFNRVVLSPPFEWRDALVTLAWMSLAGSGFLFQQYQNRGRPPFPPPPRSVRAAMPGFAYGALPRTNLQRGHESTTNPSSGNNETSPLLA